MKRKKEDRPYFDENRDYVGEHEAEVVRPLSRKVVVQEKLVVQTLRKKWLRYKDAEIVYSLEHKKILEMADQCGAIYRRDGIVLINRDIFDEYLERKNTYEQSNISWKINQRRRGQKCRF